MNSGWFSCCKKCILAGLWNHFICRFQCFAYFCYMVAMSRLNGKSIVSVLIIIINSVLLLIQLCFLFMEIKCMEVINITFM
jgi:hypothetical protein